MRTSDQIKNNALNKSSFWEKSHDKQIGSEEHDEILLWLFSNLDDLSFKKRIILTFQNFFSNKTSWSRYFKDSLKIENLLEIKKIIECPINLSKQAGFIDLLAKFSFKGRDAFYYGSETREEDTVFEINFAFEVKTEVNIGETVRQINYYRSNDSQQIHCYAVVAPPFKNSDILKTQNIIFIPYNIKQ